MAVRPKKIDEAPGIEADVPVLAQATEPDPIPVGVTLAATADEQLAGQLAIASAEDRLRAEIEAGQKAVAAAEARLRPAASE